KSNSCTCLACCTANTAAAAPASGSFCCEVGSNTVRQPPQAGRQIRPAKPAIGVDLPTSKTVASNADDTPVSESCTGENFRPSYLHPSGTHIHAHSHQSQPQQHQLNLHRSPSNHGSVSHTQLQLQSHSQSQIHSHHSQIQHQHHHSHPVVGQQQQKGYDFHLSNPLMPLQTDSPGSQHHAYHNTYPETPVVVSRQAPPHPPPPPPHRITTNIHAAGIRDHLLGTSKTTQVTEQMHIYDVGSNGVCSSKPLSSNTSIGLSLSHCQSLPRHNGPYPGLETDSSSCPCCSGFEACSAGIDEVVTPSSGPAPITVSTSSINALSVSQDSGTCCSCCCCCSAEACCLPLTGPKADPSATLVCSAGCGSGSGLSLPGPSIAGFPDVTSAPGTMPSTQLSGYGSLANALIGMNNSIFTTTACASTRHSTAGATTTADSGLSTTVAGHQSLLVRPGSILADRYQIIALIGRGTFGQMGVLVLN
ncbi:unnamed protein product, partial [Protopolystoma xenopodis]